jgi:hypothetical protein
MADIDNKYYKVQTDGVETVTSRRWLNVGIALVGVSCLVLLSIVATSASTPTLHSTSAAQSTSLIGWSPSLRSPSSRAVVKPGYHGMRDSMAPLGSSPLQRLAMTAIEANNLGSQMRDVSMKATELKEELENMDEETKAKMADVEKAVKLKAQDMAGVTGPLGFFDPLGFVADCSEGKLLFYREVELKHGRVAMLAALGFLVGEQFHPLFGGNVNVPSYIAFQQTPLQTFWPAVVAAIAIPEVFSVFTFNPPFAGVEKGFAIENGWEMRSDRMAGDFGFDPLGLKPTDPKELKVMQTKELNNGRLAMIAAAGMIAQELATGQKLF